jgi:hypothetical protein
MSHNSSFRNKLLVPSRALPSAGQPFPLESLHLPWGNHRCPWPRQPSRRFLQKWPRN